MNFERLVGSTFVARGPTNLGLFVRENGGDSLGGAAAGGRALLIDSGGDADSGRRILRESERLGVSISAVLTTHSNADHCGGNAFLRARTSCEILATDIEAAFMAHPALEPSFLSGAFPHAALQNKFFMAPEQRATVIIEPPCRVAFDGGAASAAPLPPQMPPVKTPAAASDFDILPLPGHFFGMVGVMTPDKVFFAADALVGAPVLEKHSVFFLYDVAAELETLAMLESMEADWFVPSHAEPTRDIRPLVALNRAKILEIGGYITDACRNGAARGGLCFEDILAQVCSRYSIALDAGQYVLVGSTIRSYLSWLCAAGALSYEFAGGKMVYKEKR